MLKRISAWLKPRQSDYNVSISVSPNHPMIKVSCAIDWNFLGSLASARRAEVKSHLGGPNPHTRELLGALLVRIMESCTLRKAEDLIHHYAPARLLCNLQLSNWSPNFRTISDFELMLGEQTLQKMNTYVLEVAQGLGFANIKGLCSDTTAQEAQIPHPTEVGLMSSFAKSIEAGIEVLGTKAGELRDIITSKIDDLKKHVRKYRLFAKTAEVQKVVTQKIMTSTFQILKLIKKIPAMCDGGATLKKLKKAEKKVIDRFVNLSATMEDLMPQIAYFLKTGKVTRGKIISLFLEGIHSIVRGKSGKKVEFGLKWGINQIRGGYISLFLMSKVTGEADYAVQAVKHHIALFGQPPKDFGYDRGGWSSKHLEKIRELGVKNIAVAPKGKAQWLVTEKKQNLMVKERAQVEGKIGTLKSIGFNKPHAKSTSAMVRAAHRAELRFNISKLIRDCAAKEIKRAA